MSSCKSELIRMPETLITTRKTFVRNHKKIRTWISPVCCIVTCVFVCSSVFVYTNVSVKYAEERTAKLEDEVVKLRHKFDSILSTQQDDSDDILETPEGTSQLISSSRYRRQARLNVTPFIHLVGQGKNQVTEADITYFVWKSLPNSPGKHGFDLIGDTESGYTKIRIKQSGVYLVYAQVAVNGRDNLNLPNECAHQTVRDREGEEKVVLLSSLVTQFMLGGRYQDNVHRQWLRAVDTKVHMGVFLLMVNDVLSVQIPPNCGNMEYSMTEINSYFGVAQLSKINKSQRPRPSSTTKTGQNGKKESKKQQ